MADTVREVAREARVSNAFDRPKSVTCSMAIGHPHVTPQYGGEVHLWFRAVVVSLDVKARLVCHEDVGRLEVTVHDPDGMKVGERTRDLPHCVCGIPF